MNRMQDKVAVVTGAAGGMGRAHCRRLAEEGADIIALDVAGADLDGTAAAVTELGRRCVTAVADVRDQTALDTAIAAGVRALGALDVVVANAGVYTDLGPSWELTDAAWQRTLDVNLTGVWHTVRAAAAHLAESAAIVIVGSTNGVRGGANAAHYAASKHAVVGLARTLANELGPRGIRVNLVHPGSVATPMILNETVYAKLRPDLAQPTIDDAAAVLAQRTLLPVPWVDPVDVANAVLFLASDEARTVTGTELVVDAGLTQKV
ncbi:mycofactocin-coupled SDR family oxidoreductase [Nocardia farcinica]|uniref:mycofactocin-coupled SDR family oxidoreductase n=1 Tax=Nocardia farcinica TaxID=37329 RepID=UPI000BF55F45|nr:mycofactocin-coupled SDR family oxidoreductase [Nocardia farcinica]PFX05140.1 (-)-trans-carveol dehydrogenase [Nocardia farcinica]PFX10410.1 (-)-trans-carveol dehydrogenase [Nocardia farcinica]